MADPVVPPVVPPAGDPPAVVVPVPPAPLTPEQLQAQLAETQKALRAANAEAAERRVKLTAYEKAEADRATAALSETEKLTKRATDAEAAQAAALATANERLVRAEVIAKAAALKFADPSDTLALIDRSKLQVGEDGTVTGADELLKALAAAKPYLLGKPSQAPLHTGNPGSAAEAETSEKQIRDLVYGTAGNPFDARAARAHGGGVIVSKSE